MTTHLPFGLSVSALFRLFRHDEAYNDSLLLIHQTFPLAIEPTWAVSFLASVPCIPPCSLLTYDVGRV